MCLDLIGKEFVGIVSIRACASVVSEGKVRVIGCVNKINNKNKSNDKNNHSNNNNIIIIIISIVIVSTTHDDADNHIGGLTDDDDDIDIDSSSPLSPVS